MRTLGWLGISVALALLSVGVQAADEPAGAPGRAADEPNAIGNLDAPDSASNPAPTRLDEASPVDASDDRIRIAAHQLQVKEFTDASRLLTDIVAERERRTSRYDVSLVVPLTMLGDALSGETKYPEALRSYEHAQHIARVVGGLHTTEQVDIVYREANALASMGKIDRANDRQEYAYETLERKYGPFSPDLVPGLYHLAGWYDRTSNIFAARGLYERALQILARTSGENDPSLIPALRGVATTYREERFPPYQMADEREPVGLVGSSGLPQVGQPALVVNRFGPGEQALVQIIKIMSTDPNAKPIDVAHAELDLADWYLLFDKPSRALPVYVHARQIMHDRAQLTDEQIAAYFGEPTALYRPIYGNPALPPQALRSNPTQGHVEVSYTVTPLGEVEDLKTISSEPEGMMDTKVRRGMRAARFRPRFEGDNPVASPNQVYRHTFIYYPHSEATATTKEAGASTPTGGDAPKDPESAPPAG
jgi:TonB family protein